MIAMDAVGKVLWERVKTNIVLFYMTDVFWNCFTQEVNLCFIVQCWLILNLQSVEGLLSATSLIAGTGGMASGFNLRTTASPLPNGSLKIKAALCWFGEGVLLLDSQHSVSAL